MTDKLRLVGAVVCLIALWALLPESCTQPFDATHAGASCESTCAGGSKISGRSSWRVTRPPVADSIWTARSAVIGVLRLSHCQTRPWLTRSWPANAVWVTPFSRR